MWFSGSSSNVCAVDVGVVANRKVKRKRSRAGVRVILRDGNGKARATPRFRGRGPIAGFLDKIR
jgi:hypothetical protein